MEKTRRHRSVQVRLGLRIREIRHEINLSQEKLALKAGIDRTYMNSVENGRRNISIGSLTKITTALGVSLGQFFSSPSFQ